jgi:hypothetical protein
VQPISNTSGVALALQYTPMMQRYRQKITNVSLGLRMVNELVLRTLAIKEPLTFQWDGTESDELKDGVLTVLDPSDPETYQTECHWPPPMPMDVLVKLNEIQMKMALGLESKRGALKDLGEEFPDNKSREIFLELVEDAIDQGALDMLRAQISSQIMAQTGMVMGADGAMPPPATTVPSAGGPNVNTAGDTPATTTPLPPSMTSPEGAKLAEMLNTRAYGTKLAQWRNPDNDENN